TLLGLIAGVLDGGQGEIRVMDEDIGQMSGSGRDQVRADHLGVIFQMFNLVPYLSVVQNVILPCRFSIPHFYMPKLPLTSHWHLKSPVMEF
ncbi:MAG: hypothetical protein AAFW82_09595, partial [Pseudomonadota bacterium]